MDEGRRRIVVADDHPMILAGFAALLEDRADFAVIARCTNGDEALCAILEQQPEIAVLDVHMPGQSGLAIAQAVRGGVTRIVLISAMITPSQMAAAQEFGVAGILRKDAAPNEVISCLLTVAGGGEWASATQDAARPPSTLARQLTTRELEVAQLAALGLSNKSIARRLDLSDGTVKIHMYNVFRKTGLRNRTELANLVNQGSFALFETPGRKD
jgi:two-component system nitrate/nitrite response regulator NarL